MTPSPFPLLVNFAGRSHVVQCDQERGLNDTCEKVLEHISYLEGVPAGLFKLVVNGRNVKDSDLSDGLFLDCSFGGLLGGKGGFGAALRSSGKGRGSKKTTNYGACRDLNGRRLRHVNNEIRLRMWMQQQNSLPAGTKIRPNKEGFKFDNTTATGIDGWHLDIPTWAEGFKAGRDEAYMKPRRKTAICQNWQRAREEREPPPGAPRWWGCPRGKKCDFAHGTKELRGRGKEEHDLAVAEAKKQADQASYERWTMYHETLTEDMATAVTAGLANIKQARLARLKKRAQAEAEANGDGDGDGDGDGALLSDGGSAAASLQVQHMEGQAGLGDTGEVEGRSTFPSLCLRVGDAAVAAATAAQQQQQQQVPEEGLSLAGGLVNGRWYFEAELLTAGLMQVGWAAPEFKGDDEGGNGVGDDLHSFAFDGLRHRRWHGEDEGAAYAEGCTWKVGDVVGCALDCAAGVISYSLNGESIGPAFSNLSIGENAAAASTTSAAAAASDGSRTFPRGLFPAISLERGESLRLNLGERPFKFTPPTGYDSVSSARGDAAAPPPPQPTADDDSQTNVAAAAAKRKRPSSPPPAEPEAAEKEASEKEPSQMSPPEPVDLATFSSATELHSVGLLRLKAALQSRGMKCGGTLQQRADRLWQAKGLSLDDIPYKLRSKKKTKLRR